MKRPIIIWLICTILLTLCVIISGCKTGGTTLSTGNLQKGSDGIWRLKKAPPVTPIEPKTVVEEPQSPIIITNKVEDVKVSPVPLKPVRSKPTIELESVEANEDLTPVTGVGELPPFEPSVSETPITLPTTESTPTEKSSLRPIKADVSLTNEPPNTLKIHWLVFLLGFVMLAWIIYDIIKGFISNQNPTTKKKTKNAKKKSRAKRAKNTREPKGK